jgi:hypothetical protein
MIEAKDCYDHGLARPGHKCPAMPLGLRGKAVCIPCQRQHAGLPPLAPAGPWRGALSGGGESGSRRPIKESCSAVKTMNEEPVRDGLLAELLACHGHRCRGGALGLRAGLAALRRLGAGPGDGKSLHAIVETGRRPVP